MNVLSYLQGLERQTAHALGTMELQREAMKGARQAAAERRARSARITGELIPLRELEADWRLWRACIFPDLFTTADTPEHEEFWDKAWPLILSVRDRREPPEDFNALLSIWSRNWGKSFHAEALTVAAMAIIGPGIYLYVSGTQSLANDHLASIETLLVSPEVADYYPELATPEKSRVTGGSKQWKQEALTTASGAVLKAVGLDVGVRGIRKGKDRVKWFTLDDIDDYDDSPLVAAKKANKLGHSVLPTCDTHFGVIGAQNLITEHSVFNQIVTGTEDLLGARFVSGPHPAFTELDVKMVNGRWRITHCVPRWPARVTKEVGQRFLDTFGPARLKAEFQHDFHSDKRGKMIPELDLRRSVIKWSQFKAFFGLRYPQDKVPAHWPKRVLLDWSSTDSQYHRCVLLVVARAPEGTPLAGCLFVVGEMSFGEAPNPITVGLEFLRRFAPHVRQGRYRAGASVDPGEVYEEVRYQVEQWLARDESWEMWHASHEAKTERDTLRNVLGLPFQACNPGSSGGVPQIRALATVDTTLPDPFRPEMGMGCTRLFFVSADDQVDYTSDGQPTGARDDYGLLGCRTRLPKWKWKPANLTTSGVERDKPLKMNDDEGNCLMMSEVHETFDAPELSAEAIVERHTAAGFRKGDLLAKAREEGREHLTPDEQLSYRVARTEARRRAKDELDPVVIVGDEHDAWGGGPSRPDDPFAE